MRCRRFTILAALCVWAGVLLQAQAAKVRVWHHQTPGQFEKAQLKHAVVTSEGALRLSRRLAPLASLEASHVWDLIEDHDGNLFAATGGETGKIWKIGPDGKPTVWYTAEDNQILCLALAADGALLAGTGPDGQVLRFDARGNAKPLARIGEGYVWALAVDGKSHAVYAGTGPHGKVYRIADGKADVFYATRQDHVLSIAVGPDGTVYAGTDRSGLIYRIDPKGKGFVLFQAPQPEVRRLLVANDGLYACTSSPGRRRAGGGTAASGGGSSVARGDKTSAVEAVKVAAEKEPVAEPKEKSADSAKESSKGTSASAPPAPSSGDNSLYRIAPDGTVRELFREKALLLSLLRRGDRFFVGTGMEGQLFEVSESSKERSEIARLDHGQVLSLCQRKDGSIVVGTGDPGKLYILQDRYATSGTITSEVLDAKIISKWGALRWQATTPEGTKVAVAVRAGNVAEPDETWSDWSAEQTDGDSATIQAPPARYLQYRVRLTADASGLASPSVRGIALRYMTTNQAPEVTKLEVPDLNAVNLDNPKKVKVKWSATDPNEDELSYSVYVKKEGWSNWVLLEDDLEKTEYEWDTTTAPSGMYRLRVVASDRKDNPEADAQTAERTSVPFVVSHAPPTVTLKVAGIEGERAVIEASAGSPWVRLTEASFAVNGKKWVNVFPADGLFDGKSETFRFKTEALKPGTYVLVLRVRDAAGNTGSSDVVFTVQPRGR